MASQLNTIELFIGFLIGLLSSVFLNLLYQYAIVPKIRFSSDIRKEFSPHLGRFEYWVRIKKTGFHSLIDIMVICKVRVVLRNGNIEERKTRVYRIPTSYNEATKLDGTYKNLQISFQNAKMMDASFSPDFASRFRVRDDETGARLEDVFMAFQDTELFIEIIGHDSITGIKKLYLSPSYRCFNIVEGKWDKLVVMSDRRKP